MDCGHRLALQWKVYLPVEGRALIFRICLTPPHRLLLVEKFLRMSSWEEIPDGTYVQIVEPDEILVVCDMEATEDTEDSL